MKENIRQKIYIQQLYPTLNIYLKQLIGTFHFVLILAVPTDKGGSVSPNVRLHVDSVSLPTARRLLLQEKSGRQLWRRTFG